MNVYIYISMNFMNISTHLSGNLNNNAENI